MRLDWNDIRAKAAVFARDWTGAHYERGETHSFYNAFFDVFGVPRRQVASFEKRVKLGPAEGGFIDLFWPGTLLVEQKSAGRDLKRAHEQALKYFPGLRTDELPRYVMVSDFQTFELLDLEGETREPIRFTLSELPDRVQDFGFILGQEKRVFKDQDPVNIDASLIMGALHDALDASGYKGHALERFLVRLLFCLFADDTGIFHPRGAFTDFISERTREDGSDLGPLLMQMFQALDTPEPGRLKTLDADLVKLPHINGDLFRETLPLPAFNRDMREKLLYACSFNWQKVSPAIFGSLFQSVMNDKERRKKGAHYTSEQNIMKVIEPLFLDDLRAEFARLKARRDKGRAKALEDFHEKLANLTFFDPACGCGNFLVIAYRELRLLETDVLRELHPTSQLVTDIGLYVKVNVDQFYGIEIGEFAARIAEVAMWMMDHIMNMRLSAEFGEAYLRLPLKAAPNIVHGDALEVDWARVLPPEECSYILGNPPFIGAKMQSEAQRAQVMRIAALGKSGGSLDYVAAWFLKAGAYIRSGGDARLGFVATNSITQGEQVGQLWPLLFDRYGLEIAFAHRTFQWMSDARGKAHVHCVIIGLTRREDEPKEKRLFSYESVFSEAVETRCGALCCYLTDAGAFANRHMIVDEASQPLMSAPKVVIGSKPIDGGHFIFTEEEKAEFLSREPLAARFLRPYIGSEEFINGGMRYILALHDASPHGLKALPLVLERVSKVRAFRSDSKSPATRELAFSPTTYHVNVLPDEPFLVIPKVSSERREYVPIGWISPPTIASDLLFVIRESDLAHFAILTSRMHMAWLRTVGGRLKSDYRYSVGVVYNTFPWPEANEKARVKIRALAQAVLDARAAFPDSTLADLYDPDAMPPLLRKAHRALDEAVDALYRKEGFSSDRARVEHLFVLYEKLTATLFTPKAKPKRRARKAPS